MLIANINKKHKVTALGQDSCVYLTGGKKDLALLDALTMQRDSATSAIG